jgi:metallo-beta-lactamase family protein
MKIKFLGASGTVTGSSYVLESGSGKTAILIDLGMFQGPHEIEKYNHEPFDYNGSKLTAVILTHAHLDHCGRLPILNRLGFKGNIYMTPPTKDLVELTLMDTVKIAKEEQSQSLYDLQDVLSISKNFVTIDYHQEIHIGDFLVKLYDAGHILGSSSIEIIDNSATSENRKIIFSGDIGNFPAFLEEKTEFLSSGDIVVMESTYGDRLHPNELVAEAVRAEINAVEATSGTLLIPTFSLDRAQELLHLIGHLKREGKILPETPVILDSPMAEKATKIYVDYPKLFNDHIEEDYKKGELFDFAGLEVTKNWKESQKIHERNEAKVIIAGSGMMVGGRIVGHAQHYLPFSSTRLMIVGYQGDGTLGRELLNGAKTVFINNQRVEVKASVHDSQGMSSHADQKQLMEWLKNIKSVKKLFLTHGDDEARKVLSEKIASDLNIKDIVLPKFNDLVEF